jgi:hypothetical protein
MTMTRRQILRYASYATQPPCIAICGQIQPLVCVNNVDLNEHVRPLWTMGIHVRNRNARA